MPQWLRGVLAIVAGFLFIALLAIGTDGVAHAIRALILGVLGLIFNLAAATGTWPLFPHWYTVVSLILVMPFAWPGGRIREGQLEHRGVATAPVTA